MTGIGIDTGGTYTDAVIYDFESNTIRAATKALTTREDLKKGIARVLQKLPMEELKGAEMLALSTTLATNVCVENRGGKAKLIFIGVSEKTFQESGKSYGIENPEDVYFLDCTINISGTNNTEPDWEKFENDVPELLKGCQGVSVVQLFSKKFGGNYEKEARKIIRKYFDGPVVLGKDLFSDLNAIKRGAGALLNARLVPVIHDFLEAVKKVFGDYGIEIPPVIVRSDGTLMNEAMTCEKPVETLLCGPAASIMGAMYLADEKKALVVDMGGTTTDVAVIEGGRAKKTEDGIRIGNWKTFVKGLFVDTFGLGGDTAVHYNSKGQMYLEDYRIVPVSNLAQRYPYVVEKLQKLAESEETDLFPLHEFIILIKEPADYTDYLEQEKALCKALKNGPLSFKEAAEAVGRDLYNLRTSRLEQEGCIIRAGLTPTDAMVLKGDYVMEDKRAAAFAAQYMERSTGVSTEAFADAVYHLVEKRLYCNLVRILIQTGSHVLTGAEPDQQLEKLIEYSFEMQTSGKDTAMILPQFVTDAVLVGVGAPTHIFLESVAKLLGTKAVIPRYARVANAVGAVVGNVNVTLDCEIVPVYDSAGIDSYDVFCGDVKENFKEYEDAQAYMLSHAPEAARAEAVRRGAKGEVITEVKMVRQGHLERESDLFLVEKYQVTAMGKISQQ